MLAIKDFLIHTVHMYSTNQSTKPCKPALMSKRLLDQLRERIRYMHYSLRTEEAYVYWVRIFIRWHGLRHPRDMGASEVERFLTHLATERRVSASTHKQALSALLYLYKEVLDKDLPWMQDLTRPVTRQRIPTVLTVAETRRLLLCMSDVSTTMIYTHVLKVAAGGTASPLDAWARENQDVLPDMAASELRDTRLYPSFPAPDISQTHIAMSSFRNPPR